MKRFFPILTVLFFPLAVMGQITEVSPSIANRLSTVVGDLDRQDAGHAQASGGGVSSSPNLKLISSSVGYSFSSGSADFDYGQEIIPPLVDLDDNVLTLVEARAYWRAEPVRPMEALQIGGVVVTQDDFTERYTYSRHADRVFATQTGGFEITWVTAERNADDNFFTKKESYTTGFSTDLTVQQMYWTEVTASAPRVVIPTGSVQDVVLHYNELMPAEVRVDEDAGIDERVIPPAVAPELIPKQTVWYDPSLEMIRAYNREGRVIVEYLGDLRVVEGKNNVREHLGLQIIEVRQQLNPVTVDTIIGEQLLPARTPTEILSATDYDPFQVSLANNKVASHFRENRQVFYGVQENLTPAEVEFYWLEPRPITVGAVGEIPQISWPAFRNNYRIEWPDDVSGFEAVFARPEPGTVSAGPGSFLNLDALNAPALVFQDDPNGTEAQLDLSNFQFSVDLSAGDGRNRSLIRLNNGPDFWYVRLYSGSVSHLRGLDVGGEFDANRPQDFYFSQNVTVGTRIDRPDESLSLGGYIDPAVGDAYQADVYLDPFSDGGLIAAETGAIIPVNALPGNNQLRVWWFRTLDPRAEQAALFKSIKVPSVIADYTISYPINAPEIIMASNAGTGELATLPAAGRIYYQNDSTQQGYNPNEEHALMIAGRAYALRDDLNLATSSEPFVLISHEDEDGRPEMSVFKVLREKLMADDPSLAKDLVFDYDAIAGKLLQAPLPLPLIPQPIENGASKNAEVTPANLDPVINGVAQENLAHYDRFTFEDRKGATWVYRGQHDSGSGKKLSMQYYYPTLEGFSFPELVAQPALGTIVPFLRPLNSTEDPVTGTPLTVTFTPKWPEQSPVLHFGETLVKPKFGLPQIAGQKSIELLYQQSLGEDFDDGQPSVVLHDATLNRTSQLSAVPALGEIPTSIKTSFSRGKLFFQDLPTHLQERVYFDSKVGSQGALILEGRFIDELAGEDYLLLNTFSPKDVAEMKALYIGADEMVRTAWETLVDNMKITPEYRTRDLAEREIFEDYEALLTRRGDSTILGQAAQATYGPTELPQIIDRDQVINDAALTAVGGGSGFVTLVTGNGLLNSEEGDPVSLHVFRIGEKLYQGELKALTGANPLSENVTVIHTGDFAARPDDYEFEWKKAAPVNGLAVPVYTVTEAPRSFSDTEQVLNITATGSDFIANPSSVLNLPATVLINRTAGLSYQVPGLRVGATLNVPDVTVLRNVFVSIKMDQLDGFILKVNQVEALRYRAFDGENSEVVGDVPGGLTASLTPDGSYLPFVIPARSFISGDNSIEIEFNSLKPGGNTTFLDVRAGLQTTVDNSGAYFAVDSPPRQDGKTFHVVSGSGIDTLGDNYYIMRYRPKTGHPQANQFSQWTNPALVPGWIKRVLAGINPFNQRITDFFENAIDTNTSIIASAGSRWEGDIALNLDSVQDVGLIEIYETVLKRGIDLSIGGTPSVDYGPANDALLLAAGYLNDLYVALGNEAFADAANPTVTFDSQALGPFSDTVAVAGFEDLFRSTSTSRFSFQGQVPTLLDEELALLRGRDNFLSPSIQTPPVYNRMFWNYTRGIDAGELVYALNYNIRELNDEVADGKIDGADAARMFPQAHGDAYGHYLTATKNYYRLLTDPEFTWGTRIEAVNVLGQPVSIDYFDERKFAASAGALARTADQIVSLERRKAFEKGTTAGWLDLNDTGRAKDGTTRRWGVNDWAARGGQGAYFNWLVGNAILPHEDNVNEGIQKIDRSTVPELDQVARLGRKIQNQMDAANRRVNPLDLTSDSLLVDISPSELADGKTHFTQIYERATRALKNAQGVFDRAADSTRLLRSLENQGQNLTQAVDDEEVAFNIELINIYGTPYQGDIGPGKLYPQGYAGPDLLRYQAIDRPFQLLTKEALYNYGADEDGDADVRTFTISQRNGDFIDSFGTRIANVNLFGTDDPEANPQTFSVRLPKDSGPYILAGSDWGQRESPGSLQALLGEVRLAEEQLYGGLNSMNIANGTFQRKLTKMKADLLARRAKLAVQQTLQTADFVFRTVDEGIEAIEKGLSITETTKKDIVQAAIAAVPDVVGFATDALSPAQAAIYSASLVAQAPISATKAANATYDGIATAVFIAAEKAADLAEIGIDEKTFIRSQIEELRSIYGASYAKTREVDALFVAYQRTLESYRTELSGGDTFLANRETFRKRAAAAVQGYRTRDIAFRTFRSEALEEYQTLLDWASKYAFLAAQAYDYETGLLGSDDGQAFLGKIVSSRALGMLDSEGEPMIAASANGDPGLSGLLAQLKSDYDVVEGRLGFNNPETNGTTFSLRREYFRIPDGPEGDQAWRDKLESLVSQNLLNDADVAIHAMQLGGQETQSGFLLNFPSVIEDGKNFFGKDLLAGDSTFTTTNFATKVHSVGVVFEGYQGMSPCEVCANGPGDPTHNHDDALSATPYVFLFPSGIDTMRAPPLGDGDVLRSWKVQDFALPLPFNIGSSPNSDASVDQALSGLANNFRSPRRHAAFRPTDRVEFFYTDFSADFTNSRLVGRSVWNSNWKLVIPAKGLLNDEQAALGRFIRTVKDIKLHVKSYSYSGN